MKNGRCPKCNSREIYASIDGGGIGDGFAVHVLDSGSMAPHGNGKHSFVHPAVITKIICSMKGKLRRL